MGRLAIAAQLALIDENVPRTVHRLEAETLLLDLERAEHILGVVLQVSGDRVELFVHDVRRDDRLVSAFAQALADEILHDAAHDGALRVPEDEAAAGLFLHAEQVEFLPELAMVALGRFLELKQVRVEFFLRIPGGAVDALQHRVLLVAVPIRAGDVHQFHRADLARRVRVAAAAEIGKLADRVQRDRLALGDFASDLYLIRIVCKPLDGLFARYSLTGHLVIRLDDLVHALLEAFEIFRRERLLPVEIIVEAVFDCRADGRLGVRKQILNGIGQHVCGGMAQFGKGRAVLGRCHGPALLARSGPASPSTALGRPAGMRPCLVNNGTVASGGLSRLVPEQLWT